MGNFDEGFNMAKIQWPDLGKNFIQRFNPHRLEYLEKYKRENAEMNRTHHITMNSSNIELIETKFRNSHDPRAMASS